MRSSPITNREWVTSHILWNSLITPFYDQQVVSDIAHFVKGSLFYFLWPTGCGWYCTFCDGSLITFICYDLQLVSDFAHFVKAILITSVLWPTASEWHHTFCEWQSFHILSYDYQQVSDIVHLHERQSHHILSYNQRVSDMVFVKGNLVTSYNQQLVSHIQVRHFVNGSLISSFPMTNRMWVILQILQKAVLWHIFLTNSKWMISHIVWKLVTSHLLLSQQLVSDMANFAKVSLITSFSMTTVCEWHCIFCGRQSHHIFSNEWQEVGDIAHFVKGSLVPSLHITNRMWVTLHILWKAVPSHLFLSLTACKCHCTWFSESQSHPHLFVWLTGSECHCTFCEQKFHDISSYHQQFVGDIAHFVKDSFIASFHITNSL